MKTNDHWFTILPGSDFSLANLPFGIFSRGDSAKSVGVAAGNFVMDLPALAEAGFLDSWPFDQRVLEAEFLNPLIALGKPAVLQLREILKALLASPDSSLRACWQEFLIERTEVLLHLPVSVGDYTDFYASREHATQVGKLFRPEQPLLPNWQHLPVAYHGRASSLVVSGTPVRRPLGQWKDPGTGLPGFGPTRELDFELELGFITGADSKIGVPVAAAQAEDYIFGVVLLNDWSARDFQRWEYQPLGPFTSKNFVTSISPWVVVLEALKPCRVSGPLQDPAPLPYLQTNGAQNFDIQLSVALKPDNAEAEVITKTNSRLLYWNIRQQVAHHTITGCNLRVGDILATGTISGEPDSTRGCLLEMNYGGKKPVSVGEQERFFLQDGDEVVLRGFTETAEGRVGFGEVSGRVIPASIVNKG